MKIAVIGCGTVSDYGHLPAIAASDKWELAAVADVNGERAAAAAKKHGAGLATRDYREALAVPGLRSVVVATHVDTHAEITVDALSRGLHVFCEKPMASTPGDCRRMVDAARQHDRLLAINFNTRSQAAWRSVRRHVRDGAVGRVRVVRVVYNWSNHHWQPPERLAAFMAGGGPIVDSGVHFFDGVRALTGQEIDHVEAAGTCDAPGDNPQHVIATCRLSGGAVALVEAGWLWCRRTKDDAAVYQLHVVGDDGTIDCDVLAGDIHLYGRDGTLHEQIGSAEKGFDWIYDRWAESVATGRLLDLGSGEDGSAATEASLQALASAKAKRA